jgi:hypothetical protein
MSDMKTVAIISTLHDGAMPDCANRRFRNEPVLAWTLRRVRLCPQIAEIAVLCWEDQAPAVQPIASAGGAFVLAKGPRCPLPMVEAIAAARRWSDGWRGGLVGACHFDVGFHAPWMLEIARKLEAEAAVLVEADAGLVDPKLLGQLIEHADAHPQIDFVFTPAAPGLNGVLLRAAAIEQLSAAGGWPGRLVCYWPDLPGRDPVAKEECAAVPTAAEAATPSAPPAPTKIFLLYPAIPITSCGTIWPMERIRSWPPPASSTSTWIGML